MVFNLFRVKIIVRLILLIAVFLAFAYFVQKPFYYFTSIELLIVAILLIVELIYFIEKGYRQLNNMLQSVKEKDFSMSFSQVEQSKTLSNLALLLNDLSEAYRQVRIEKEVHYQFLNHIVDQVNQVMVCFDSDGNVTLSNSAAKKVLAVNSIFNVSSFSKIDPSLPKKLLNIREGQEKLLSLF
jgi:signal transduction histidine kinase